MRRLFLLLMAVALVVGVRQSCSERQVRRPLPGILVAEAPEQRPLSRGEAPAFRIGDYRIEPQAAYRLRARLLSRKAYRLGREAELSSLDFALGWGPMSDSSLLSKLSISQSGRFFWLRWDETPPVSPQEIFGSAANTHLIPADDTVRRTLDRMRPGHVIGLHGLLVNASAPDGWSWRTSLMRHDTGAGACELFWVVDAWIESDTNA